MRILPVSKERFERRGKLRATLSYFKTLVVVGMIFGLGVLVGQGRISLTGVNRQPVSSNIPRDLDYSTVEAVYDSLKANFDGQLDETKLLDGAKVGLAKATGDPYTEYLNPEDAKEFNEDLNGTFTGIGAELNKDPETNSIVIIAPIAGFPAEKAGIKPKDIIVEIDGKSAYDITVSEAVKRIRGQAGTNVKLRVIRDQTQDLSFEITREQITIPSVTTEIKAGNIGYIKIARFAEDTTSLTRKAAESFKTAAVKGIILDMRSDPGGLLDAAVNVSSLWLDKKVVLTERRGGEVVKTFNSTGTPLLNGIPTVVLVDGGSASASEITAGALRDHDAATVIGEKSYGKGSVQQLVNFGDSSYLKVTIARWYTPDGKNIDKEGITPDQEVKNSDDDLKAGKDAQLEAALTKLR